MNKILVDTSVWVDALNGKKTKQSNLLQEGIKEDKDFNKVKDALAGFEVLRIDQLEAALRAASLYRELRKKGPAIHKSNDCLIAFYSITSNSDLLHTDADFDKIAQYTSLKIVRY